MMYRLVIVFGVLLGLVLAALVDAAQTVRAADTDPPLVYMALSCPNGCELQVGDRFSATFAVYSDDVAPDSEFQLWPSCCDLPAGLTIDSRAATGGSFDGDAWTGRVWLDHPATITYTYTVLADGPVGVNLVALPWHAQRWLNDEALIPPSVELVEHVRVTRRMQLFFPFLTV